MKQNFTSRSPLVLFSCMPAAVLWTLVAAISASGAQPKPYPELPEGITSFGAAVVGNSLYVYGGHHGQAHQYSNEGQSNLLTRLKLDSPEKWEIVSKGPRLQGLALVAHGGKLYRVGGFTAHNKEGEKHDLRSVADFARFDPETNKWEKLPPLPEPRSSHDAVVIGDRLYVAGGWKLAGENKTVWHDTAYQIDLSADKLSWQPLSKPPFQRRALSLGQVGGKLYVIGGMEKKGGPTTAVAVFDPEKAEWSQGPKLVGKGMEGFGSSSFDVAGRLYTSTYSGNLQRLSADGKSWEVAKKLDYDRFFHRMLPLDASHLIMVGGASMSSGKQLELETVDVTKLD